MNRFCVINPKLLIAVLTTANLLLAPCGSPAFAEAQVAVPPQGAGSPQEAASAHFATITEKALLIHQAWNLRFLDGEKLLGTFSFAVKGGTWVLSTSPAPATEPSTQPVAESVPLFYGDQNYIYDLRTCERCNYTALYRLPSARILRLILANIQPQSIQSTLGSLTSSTDEVGTSGEKLTRMRFERLPPTTKGGPTIISAEHPATDVLVDTKNNLIVGIRDVDQGRGDGVMCFANGAADGAFPSLFAIAEVQENSRGQFEKVLGSLAQKAQLAPANVTQADELLKIARSRMQAAVFFSTPTQLLESVDATRRNCDANPADVTGQLAYAQALFASGDLKGGVAQWRQIDQKLADPILKQRLNATLIKDAISSASRVTDDGSKLASVTSSVLEILEQIAAVSDDQQWRVVSPQLLPVWKRLRQQNSLTEAVRQVLDGNLFTRICDSGSVVVDMMLIAYAHEGGVTQAMIDSRLDAIASQPLPKSGYVQSPLSNLVAAAVSGGDVNRARKWLSQTNWHEASSPSDQAVHASINDALDSGVSVKAGDGSKLVAAVAAFSHLATTGLASDPSAAAVRGWLVHAGCMMAVKSSADLIEPSAAEAHASQYWEAVLLTLSRSGRLNSGQKMDDEKLLNLADHFAKVFNRPSIVSEILVKLSDRDRFVPGLLAARRQHLEAALAKAPDDKTRLLVMRKMAEYFVDLKEPDQAISVLLNGSKNITDLQALGEVRAMQQNLQRRQAALARQQLHQQSVIDNAGAQSRLELVKH